MREDKEIINESRCYEFKAIIVDKSKEISLNRYDEKIESFRRK